MMLRLTKEILCDPWWEQHTLRKLLEYHLGDNLDIRILCQPKEHLVRGKGEVCHSLSAWLHAPILR